MAADVDVIAVDKNGFPVIVKRKKYHFYGSLVQIQGFQFDFSVGLSREARLVTLSFEAAMNFRGLMTGKPIKHFDKRTFLFDYRRFQTKGRLRSRYFRLMDL